MANLVSYYPSYIYIYMYHCEQGGIILIQHTRCSRKVEGMRMKIREATGRIHKIRKPDHHRSVPAGYHQLPAVGSMGFKRTSPGRWWWSISTGHRMEVDSPRKLPRRQPCISHRPFFYSSSYNCHQRKTLSFTPHWNLRPRQTCFWQNLT